MDSNAPIPARMLNEYAYCPRLMYLEWMQGEWADNADTLDGKFAHRRVDAPQTERTEVHNRSLHLTSEALGVTAVVDLIEANGGRARPVDYKRGKRPHVAEGAYEPERVQVCVQGLLLRERGYNVNEGVIYYVASKEKVRIRLTDALIARTLALIAEVRALIADPRLPDPLDDSPKCPRCSLVGICLPDETRFLNRRGAVRPIAVGDPHTHPLIVAEPGSKLRLNGDSLEVHRDGAKVASVGLPQTSQVVLTAGAEASSGAIRACCEHGISVSYESAGGWFYGMTIGMAHKNVEVRIAQYRAADDGTRRLAAARALVTAKIKNARVLLRRNGAPGPADLGELESYTRQTAQCDDLEALLALEGNASRVYFSAFSTMLKGDAEIADAFAMERRTRRPPQDPINALLSLAYSALTRDWTTTLHKVGLDPMLGLYHAPRYGKPALALDLMEPFRPVIADSVVVSVINNGEIGADDFFEREGGVYLKAGARRAFYAAYERRMGTQIAHPLFGYRCTYRRIFELEARLMSRWLLDEIPEFPSFTVR